MSFQDVERRLSLTFSGLSRLAEQQAQQLVLASATECLADIVTHWPVDLGISRAAWTGPTAAGPLAYTLSNPVVYAAVIEYGGYRGVGPKTAAFSGEDLGEGITINAGIYPTQSPQAPVRRALATQAVELPKQLSQAIRDGFR